MFSAPRLRILEEILLYLLQRPQFSLQRESESTICQTSSILLAFWLAGVNSESPSAQARTTALPWDYRPTQGQGPRLSLYLIIF